METPSSWKVNNLQRMGNRSPMRHFMPVCIWNTRNILECVMFLFFGGFTSQNEGGPGRSLRPDHCGSTHMGTTPRNF